MDANARWAPNSSWIRGGMGAEVKKKDAFDSLENGVHVDSFERNHSRSAIGDEKANKPKYRKHYEGKKRFIRCVSFS